MNTLHRTLIIASFSALLAGCQEKIDLELPPNEAELVVEGYYGGFDFYLPDGDLDCFGELVITQEELLLAAFAAAAFPIDSVEAEADYWAFNKVRLTSTSDYFSNGESPAVSGATVVLYENGTPVETLAEMADQPGSYRITHPPVVDAEYHLEIDALNNHYTTIPDVYEAVPPLFGLTATYRPNFIGDSCAFFMGIQTFERAGEGNHYRWFHYLNNKYVNDPFSLSYTDDANFDGLCLIDIDVYNSELELGDTLVTFQMATSETYFNFMTSLQNQTAFTGSPFDTPPAPTRGNIKNETTGRYAYGIFETGGISANAVVAPDEIPEEGCGL